MEYSFNGTLGSPAISLIEDEGTGEVMVKSGLNNITVYDNDEYEVENIFRHKFPINLNGYNKAIISDFEINNYHPQIKTEVNELRHKLNKYFEYYDKFAEVEEHYPSNKDR